MKRMMTALAAAGLAGAVIAEVPEVKIDCANPGGWTFATSGVEKDGVAEVTIRMSAAKEATPPTFDASFVVSGAGADHCWSPITDNVEANQIWPTEWGNGKPRYSSQLASGSPVATVFRDNGDNTLTIACSESFRKVQYAPSIGASNCKLTGRFRFFTAFEPPMKSYEVTLRIDRRRRQWSDCVTDASDWIMAKNGFKPCRVPESAYDPVYSSWYAFWQDVHAGELEAEAPLAAELGMKTMILDDGWQKEKSRTYYSATGDWMPVKGRFPDMAGHVKKVQAAGMKYMLWISLPYVGDESKAWPRFKDKFLYAPFLDGGGMGVLDPRFPEVRKYIVDTCVRMVRDWGFDGIKADFIDWFILDKDFNYAHIEGDPAEKDNYAGRDIKSVQVAVDVMMKEILKEVQAVKPDALFEFRQRYMGPAIRQYGNMIRACDCPADPDKIRRLVCDLRLTSGTTPVHSDMLVWSPDETPERAARPILDSLFSVIQYSMVLKRIPPKHKEVIRHWLKFTQTHRDTLLKSYFRPHHPERNYNMVEAESASERIVAVYSDGLKCEVRGDKAQYVVNASERSEMILEFKAPASAEVYDVFGKLVRKDAVGAGLRAFEVPCSGYVKFSAR